MLSLTFFGGSQGTALSAGQGMAQTYSMEQVFDDRSEPEKIEVSEDGAANTNKRIEF